MFTIAQQCSQAGQAYLEAQLANFSMLALAAYDSGVLMAERNVEALRATLAAGTVAAQELLSLPGRALQ